MSLLADLLSKIKPPQTTRDIPPNLKNIFQSPAQKSADRRRIVLLSGLFAVAVLAGFFLVHFINTLSEEPAETMRTAPQRRVAASEQTQTAPDKVNEGILPAEVVVECIFRECLCFIDRDTFAFERGMYNPY